MDWQVAMSPRYIFAPPLTDGIEEHDPAGRIVQLAQDSDLDRALRIEELDFLESSPHDH